MSLSACQPAALCELDSDIRWRPVCHCGWKALFTETDRATALMRAYRHDEHKNGATSLGADPGRR